MERTYWRPQDRRAAGSGPGHAFSNFSTDRRRAVAIDAAISAGADAGIAARQQLFGRGDYRVPDDLRDHAASHQVDIALAV